MLDIINTILEKFLKLFKVLCLQYKHENKLFS